MQTLIETSKTNTLLENIISQLDISPSKYKEAMDHFEAVKNHLENGEYERSIGKGTAYVQGSFLLGTVVRPLRYGQEADYDLDVVFDLPLSKFDVEPAHLKKVVGDRLREKSIYKGMLKQEGRRCWTLVYSSQDAIGFHLDILPAIPDEPQRSTGQIAITHREAERYEWRSSNPRGYGLWFKQKQQNIFRQLQKAAKTRLWESEPHVYKSADEIPDALVKTPLQRTVQILKRHRDVRFAGKHNEEDKPISIILTTLSAQVYNGEADVTSSVSRVIERLHSHAILLSSDWIHKAESLSEALVRRDANGHWYIPNPVNPNENFADRWHEDNHRKARAFFEWLSLAKTDLVDGFGDDSLENTAKHLSPIFGERAIRKALPDVQFSADRETAPFVQIKNPAKPWGR